MTGYTFPRKTFASTKMEKSDGVHRSHDCNAGTMSADHHVSLHGVSQHSFKDMVAEDSSNLASPLISDLFYPYVG